jgi:type I restriction enzyme S subunit
MIAGLFEEQAESLYEQIKLLLDANQKLRAARDLLLPRLMSGELTAG